MIDTATLVAEVKANMARLDACTGPHAFEEETQLRPGYVVPDHVCARCGGRVMMTQRLWYERGLVHGLATASKIEAVDAAANAIAASDAISGIRAELHRLRAALAAIKNGSGEYRDAAALAREALGDVEVRA